MLPLSPGGLLQQPTIFYTNNNPMICGDISSVGGQSSSTDESDSTMSFSVNVRYTIVEEFFLIMLYIISF
jgi:hypothetical protein